MYFSSSFRRRLAWLAISAMLLAALAPAMSRALAAAAPGARPVWEEICSAASKTHSFAAPGMHGAGSLDHCGYCVLDGQSPAMLQLPAVMLAGLMPSAMQPLLYLHAPDVLHAWAAAQPRGPPSFLS